MYVFLDAEYISKDPFFKSIHHKLLLKLAKDKQLKILVYESNISKIQRKYKRQLENLLNELSPKMKNLHSLIKDTTPIISSSKLKEYNAQIESYYDNLLSRKVLNLIPYYSNITPDLVTKGNFKQFIPWLSYIQFLKQNNIQHAYFITENKEIDQYIRHTPFEDLEITIYSSITQMMKKCHDIRMLKQPIDELDLEYSTKAEKNRYLSNVIILNFAENIEQEFRHYLFAHQSEASNDWNIKLLLEGLHLEITLLVDTVLIEGRIVVETETQKDTPLKQPIFSGAASSEIKEETKYWMSITMELTKQLEGQNFEVHEIKPI
ncbi:hypothetical protein [Bacillus sp. Marseille-Q3570]|uniref:hypothetical protein n=1 Tax=Bacillus sp. Marseille-Q3570 TaxID=2963522 RepID=UPI0021B82F80|nr:hypothetical protein [Bacillus sp. Marseille-Q3570]